MERTEETNQIPEEQQEKPAPDDLKKVLGEEDLKPLDI